MRVGIDTYSYHRYLGEVYPVQNRPEQELSYEQVVDAAIALGIEGLSIETCFLQEPVQAHCRRLTRQARDRGVEVILAWGHPLGLHGGNSDEAQQDMEECIGLCAKIGIDTLRIVGSNRRLMGTAPKELQAERTALRLKESIKRAEDHGVRLAMENHQDFLAEDILDIIREVDSPFLGVNYDTGNSLRLQEEPVHAATLLAPHIFATHLKDVLPVWGGNPRDWTFYAAVPAGRGIVNLPGVIRAIQAAGYEGVFAIELDYLHPDYPDEFSVLEESLSYLKKLPAQEI